MGLRVPSAGLIAKRRNGRGRGDHPVTSPEVEDDAVDVTAATPERRREDLLARLTDLWRQSGELARHVSDVVALRNEIDDVRRDRTFDARNGAAWRAIIDTRDAAILDLVSFGKTLYRDERPTPKAGEPQTIRGASATDTSCLRRTTSSWTSTR